MAIPDTNASLLVRLKDTGNAAAWEAFVGNYGPLVYGFGLKRGIPMDEADDFVQETMRRVARSIGRFEYDPSAGRFRSWLFQIARHVLMNRYRSAGRRIVLEGGSTLLRAAETGRNAEEEASWREQWEREYRRQLFARAAERIKEASEPEQWESFWRTAVLGESGETVAADFGIEIGALYVRRSRMTKRLREEVARIEAEWERDLEGAVP